MLPLVLVLLVATSALSAPSITVFQGSANSIPLPPDNGGVNSGLIEGLFGILDTGDLNVYVLTNLAILNDMANSGDPTLQATAVGQALSMVGELLGAPGDSCEYAALANASAGGNSQAVASQLSAYINRLSANIDAITQVAINPNSVNSLAVANSGCAGGGRSYQFEPLWDNALAGSNAYTIGLLNEQYCTVRRLYSSFSKRSNTVAAAVSAAVVPEVGRLLQSSVGPLANFLRAVSSGGNPSQAAAQAKSSLYQSSY